MPTLSPKQKQVFQFVTKYTMKRGFAPSQKEIGKHIGVTSSATVYQHLAALESKGYLRKRKNQPRSIITQTTDRLIQIPLLGIIAAGQPIEAIENKETIAVSQNKLPFSGGEYYALRVSGDSMIEENINDGDIVLVKKQNTAQNGEKVVALIDNSGATLKTFYKEKNRIRLQPANKNMRPIILDKNTPVAIQGLVVDVIQNETRFQTQNFAPSSALKWNQKRPLNKIILGDALKELKKLPDESCDVIIADPPYNIGKNFGNNFDKRELDKYIIWCKQWIHECIRVMKPTATLFIYGFSEILAHLSVQISLPKRWLIWHYTNKNMVSASFWQRSHEAIICAWKRKPIFNTDEIREPYTEGFLNGAAGKVRTGKSIGRLSRRGIDTIYNAHPNGALPRDVLKIPALAGGAGMIERWFLCKTCNDVFEPRQLQKHAGHHILKHPTQKPLELSKKLIKSAMPKGTGVVLIPFAGTGSECVAAKALGQSYLGFEINPDYTLLARKWLALS